MDCDISKLVELSLEHLRRAARLGVISSPSALLVPGAPSVAAAVGRRAPGLEAGKKRHMVRGGVQAEHEEGKGREDKREGDLEERRHRWNGGVTARCRPDARELYKRSCAGGTRAAAGVVLLAWAR